METKKLLKPEQYIISLPTNKIDLATLMLVLASWLASFLLVLFFFDGTKVIAAIFSEANFNPLENSLATNLIIRDLSIILLIFLIVYSAFVIIFNLIIKGALSLARKKITLIKLLNIYIYMELVIGLVYLITIIILIPFAKLKLLPQAAEPTQVEYYVVNLYLLITTILAIIIYIFGIKISLNKNNNHLYQEDNTVL